MSKDKDPNEGLADDAKLATDLGDEKARAAEQLSYFGGDPDEHEDTSALDRGDSLEPETDEDEDKGDEVEDTEKKEDDEGSEDEGEESDDSEDDDSDESEDEDDAEDEDADDGDQDDSAEDDSEGDDAPTSKDAERGIPRSRFNEVNERMKAAEAKIAQLETTETAKEEAAVQRYDFDTKEDEYMELLLDGKTSEAKAVRAEIREAEKAEFVAETKKETVEEVSSVRIQEEVDSLANQAEKLYPVLDDSHPDYNPKVVHKVMTFMRGYQADGLTPDNALVAGLADAIELYDLDAGDEVTEDEDTKEDPKPKKKAAIKKTKEKLALQKKQGHSPAGEGKSSSDAGAVVPDIETMTDEEIDALPAKTLARLRGDFPE